MLDFFLIVVLVLCGIYWSHAMRAREIALLAAKMHCQKMNLFLLDEYVALNGQWIKRDNLGRVKAWRSYQFEFSSTGNERYNGKVIMLSDKVISIQLDPYRIPD